MLMVSSNQNKRQKLAGSDKVGASFSCLKERYESNHAGISQNLENTLSNSLNVVRSVMFYQKFRSLDSTFTYFKST